MLDMKKGKLLEQLSKQLVEAERMMCCKIRGLETAISNLAFSKTYNLNAASKWAMEGLQARLLELQTELSLIRVLIVMLDQGTPIHQNDGDYLC